MIIYDAGEYHLGFIWSFEGSTIPKATLFSLPAAFMAMVWSYLLHTYPEELRFVQAMSQSAVWSILVAVLGILLGFRTNKAYARFWEGTTLVQQMRAEWFEACNNLVAFSKMALMKSPKDLQTRNLVKKFQYTLIRLVSLMHGAALRQVTGGDGEEFDVLDVHGLDDESMDYLGLECALHDINRVEVLLHWVQVLITDSIADGVLVVPPPILTRSYQTLSRGMVNLHNVRKLADVPFPFPLSQIIIVLLLVQTCVTPLLVAALLQSMPGVFIITFLPMFGMWSITLISGELEQPFGQDPNDLPLAELQFEMNNSLLMLLDERSQVTPGLKEDAIMDVHTLRNHLGEPSSSTAFLGTVTVANVRQSRMKKSKKSIISADGRASAAWAGDTNPVRPPADSPSTIESVLSPQEEAEETKSETTVSKAGSVHAKADVDMHSSLSKENTAHSQTVACFSSYSLPGEPPCQATVVDVGGMKPILAEAGPVPNAVQTAQAVHTMHAVQTTQMTRTDRTQNISLLEQTQTLSPNIACESPRCESAAPHHGVLPPTVDGFPNGIHGASGRGNSFSSDFEDAPEFRNVRVLEEPEPPKDSFVAGPLFGSFSAAAPRFETATQSADPIPPTAGARLFDGGRWDSSDMGQLNLPTPAETGRSLVDDNPVLRGIRTGGLSGKRCVEQPRGPTHSEESAPQPGYSQASVRPADAPSAKPKAGTTRKNAGRGSSVKDNDCSREGGPSDTSAVSQSKPKPRKDESVRSTDQKAL
eukprot:TRINITY_DN7635_c0_g2_i2.p1 TRINITY_DN7635_c0_g2~~TRINITY_DN7635_c0_g2_i2.p1  ORF type:complete len:758 (+),score=115.81 TRINITY_DN7635_c0_g2_i2:167-2440(+)